MKLKNFQLRYPGTGKREGRRERGKRKERGREGRREGRREGGMDGDREREREGEVLLVYIYISYYRLSFHSGMKLYSNIKDDNFIQFNG